MPRTRHPRGLYVLFFTEMWERFSYYGMRALLMLYMVQALGLDVAHAGRLYGLYTAGVYLTPLLGGFLADRLLGAQRAVTWGASLMALGHFAMALSPMPFFYVALGLLVVGCGLFKPNLSVLVGDLYHADDPRRDQAFGLFYMGINLGAALAPLVCGTLGQRYGWHWGFGAAGVGMVFGLLIFQQGRRHVVPASLAAEVPAQPIVDATADAPTPELAVGTQDSLDAAPGQPPSVAPFVTGCVEREHAVGRPHPAEAAAVVREAPAPKVVAQRLLVLLALALFGNVIFWSAYEQAGSSMAVFVDRYCDLRLFGGAWQVPSSWYQAVNPLFIILLTPALGITWSALHAWRKEPSTPMKFVIGLGCLSLSFAVVRAAGGHADAGEPVPLSWLLFATFVSTLGELCISPVGLSAVTRLAPPRYASVAMGAWLASIALGNYLAGELASNFGQVPHVIFFAVPMVSAGLAAMFLWLLSPSLRRMMHAPS